MKYLIADNLSSLTESQLEVMLEALPVWRRNRVLRFKHFKGRAQSTQVFLLLQQLMVEEYGISSIPEFTYNEHGKPYFSSLKHIHFNMSHCSNAVICAVDRNPVGVDIEQVGRFSESLARHVLNDEEYLAVVKSSSPDVAFIRFWTQKESLVKLTGAGIRDNMKNILLPEFRQNIQISTTECLEKGYVYSIATCR